MSFLRRIFGRKQAEAAQPTDVPASDDNLDEKQGGGRGPLQVSVDLDSFRPESRSGFQALVAKTAGCPLFEGSIEHAYTKEHVGVTDRCPRCSATTERKVANFVYATDSAPRAMWAPAGFFCTACPTVIIDEELIAAGVKHGFEFRWVVGIDYGEKKRMDVFRTWNGKKPVYVLDENEQFSDLVTHDDIRPAGGVTVSRAHDARNRKRKRKLADKARRRNRRK